MLTKSTIKAKFPEVYDSYTLQTECPESKYVEKMRYLEGNGITCFERWVVPYFLEREKEKKRPCLRFNYPSGGKCNDCVRNICRYDKMCFMCGLEGHGAFQTHATGKNKGDLKCTKHRTFVNQVAAIHSQYALEEEDIKALFTPSSPSVPSTVSNRSPPSASVTPGRGFTVPAVAIADSPPQAAFGVAAARRSASQPTGQSPQPPRVDPGTNASMAPLMNPAPSVSAWGTPASATPSSDSSPANNTPNKESSNVNQQLPGWGQSSQPGQPLHSAVDNIQQMQYLSQLQPQYLPNPNFPISGFQKSDGTNTTAFGSVNPPAAPLTNTTSANNKDGILSFQDDLNANSFRFPLNGPPGVFPAGPGAAFGAAGGSNFNMSSTPSPNVMGPIVAYDIPDMELGGGKGPGVPCSVMHLAVVPGNLIRQYQQPLTIASSELSNILNVSVYKAQIVKFSPTEESPGTNSICPPLPVQVSVVKRNIPAFGMSNNTGSLYCVNSKHLLLQQEIKAMRKLVSMCGNQHVARILHPTALDISYPVSTSAGQPPAGAPFSSLLNSLAISSTAAAATTTVQEYTCIVQEYSIHGTMDLFMSNRLNSIQSCGQPSKPSPAFSLPDLQVIAIQLIESLMQVHGTLQISHGGLKPSSILVSDVDVYHTKAFGTTSSCSGHVLKLCDLPFQALLKRENNQFGDNSNSAVMFDCWSAPEAAELLSTGKTVVNTGGAWMAGDVWSLGLVLYYVATNGQCPFNSYSQACQAAQDPNYRKTCLETHGLHAQYPVLYDLIERMVRPVNQQRSSLMSCRCHPFLWSVTTRQDLLVAFGTVSALVTASPDSPIPSPSLVPHPTPAAAATLQAMADMNSTATSKTSMETFMKLLDHYSGHYVFQADQGWPVRMHQEYLALVQPVSLKTDFWWSGQRLVQAIRNQILFPEALNSLHQRQEHANANAIMNNGKNHVMATYLSRILDQDFPRLSILLFELGSLYGTWVWDEDATVSYKWR